MRIAIITGASSGLGSELVKQLDARDEMDEFWIIARRRDRLEALSKRIMSKTRIFSYDLTQTASFDE